MNDLALPSNEIGPSDAQRDAIFIQEYARTGDAAAACIRAGITDPRFPIELVARRMLRRPEIIGAIRAVKSVAKTEPGIDQGRESICAEMTTVFMSAMAESQFSAAINAKRLQAQLLGLLEQKVTITHKQSAEDLTDQELTQILRNRSVLGEAIDITDADADTDHAAGRGNGATPPPEGEE